MKELIDLVDFKYKTVLDEKDYKKYHQMAVFCDEHEDSINTMNYKELNKYYCQNKKTYLLDGSEPSEDNWRAFLKDPDINRIFLDSVISSQSATLRKLIANIDADKNLSQGDMKALNALMELVKSTEAREQSVHYIQLNAPVAFGNLEVDSKKIIEDLTKKES